MKYVIIGCGASGFAAAQTIKKLEPQTDVALVSSEQWPFYVKPTLADFITETVDASRMGRVTQETLEQEGYHLFLGTRVSQVIPEENTVIFSDNQRLQYQYLLISSGLRPNFEENLLPHKEKLRVMNSLADAVRLKNEAQRGNKVVVIGGDHYGLELARAFHQLKYEITYITNSSIFWPEGDPIPRQDVLSLLEHQRIQLLWDVEIRDIIDLDGESYRLITSDGNHLNAQLLVYAPQYVPNVDFLAGSKVKIDRGIVVSEDLKSSVPNIFASGDVAQVYDINKGLNRMNFGWVSAIKQGEAAGRNMVGQDHIFIPAKEEYFMTMYGEKLLSRWK